MINVFCSRLVEMMFFLGTHTYYLRIKGKSYNYLQIKNVIKQGYFLLNKIMFLFFWRCSDTRELNVVLLKGGEIEIDYFEG